MKLDNLSKHGILTGFLTIILLVLILVIQCSKISDIQERKELHELYNSAPSIKLPVGVLIVTLILIIITGLMVIGILKGRYTFMAPWIIIFIIGLIGQVIYYIYDMTKFEYFDINTMVTNTFLTGAQILIISPIIILFISIRSKRAELRS